MKKLKSLCMCFLMVMVFGSMISPLARAEGLTGNDKYLPSEAQYKIVTLKTAWDRAYETSNTTQMAELHNEANKIRDSYKGIYYAINGSTYTDDDIIRVAALINHEAATNDIDRFMVGSTFVNRWHFGYWGTTTAKVLSAPGQYYNEYGDPKHKQFVKDVVSNGWTKENNRFLYIANACLSGDFTTPSNVYGQSAGKQGVLYMYVNNKQLCNASFFYNHQYCTMFGGEALSATDWAGQPARTNVKAIDAIYELAACFEG